MFKSLLSILFTEILFLVWIFASGLIFMYLVPEYWFVLTVVSVILLIIVHPVLFGRFDKYDK
ncbi:hypothetical protein CD006_11395 [Enterobacter sp. 10-1]|nr:hypothetical protein CD006_11395 [Enterobacter sp. 10-1]